MSFVGDFIGDVVGGITGAKQAGEAAASAGELQAQAAMDAVKEQRRQFDKLVSLMSPYVSAGESAMYGQQALTGLKGTEAQRLSIAALEQSPEMQAAVQQGENALLQNASATGGLRGGNVQAALAQFRPQVLSSLINQQYARLGGLTSVGQASAAGQAAQGMTMASNIGNLLGQAGAAQAGGILAQGSVPSQSFGNALNLGGLILGGMSLFGGGSAAAGGSGLTAGGGGGLASMGGGTGLRF